MKRELREELNRLAKEVFGTSSRWQKIVNNGVAEPHTRERQAMVPVGGTLQLKTFVDKKDIVRHYSVDEVLKLMKDLLDTRNGLEAKYAESSTPSVQKITEGAPTT